jgi:hypothetical protein
VRSGFIVTDLIFAESRSLLFGQPLANTVAEALAAEVMFPNVAGKADEFIYAVVVALSGTKVKPIATLDINPDAKTGTIKNQCIILFIKRLKAFNIHQRNRCI